VAGQRRASDRGPTTTDRPGNPGPPEAWETAPGEAGETQTR
jgi:hypothetical protein